MARVIGFLVSYWLTCALVVLLVVFVLEARSGIDRGWDDFLNRLPILVILGSAYLMFVTALWFLLIRAILLLTNVQHWSFFALGGAGLGGAVFYSGLVSDSVWGMVIVGAIAGAVYRWLELRLVLFAPQENTNA